MTGYIFTWEPEKTGKWIEDKYDVDGWFEKQIGKPDDIDPVPMVNWLADNNSN